MPEEGKPKIIISDKQAALCLIIGGLIVRRGMYIASGNAEGSDQTFAEGANLIDPSHVILYLPNSHFNLDKVKIGNRVTYELKPEWKEAARAVHPVFDFLSPFTQKLLTRNAGIVSRSDKMIACPDHKKKGLGGTGHAMRVAEAKGIPILDISETQSFKDVTDFLS